MPSADGKDAGVQTSQIASCSALAGLLFHGIAVTLGLHYCAEYGA